MIVLLNICVCYAFLCLFEYCILFRKHSCGCLCNKSEFSTVNVVIPAGIWSDQTFCHQCLTRPAVASQVQGRRRDKDLTHRTALIYKHNHHRPPAAREYGTYFYKCACVFVFTVERERGLPVQMGLWVESTL